MKKVIKLIWIPIGILLLTACKKERLDGEYSAQLIGTWQWSQSRHISYIWPNIDTTFFYPSSTNELELEFCEKGKLFLNQAGEDRMKFRINEISDSEEGITQRFRLNLEGKEDHEFVLWFYKNEAIPFFTVYEDLEFLELDDKVNLPNGDVFSTFVKIQ